MNTGKKTILMILGTGCHQAVTLLIIMVLSRILSKEEYATYSQSMLIYRTLLPVLQLGVPSAISYFVPQVVNIYQEKKVTQNALTILSIGALIAFLLVAYFRDIISVMYNNPQLRSVAVFVAVYIFFEIINAAMPNYYLAINKNKRFAIITIVISTIRAISVIGSYLVLREIKYTFIALAAVSIIKTSIFVLDLFKRYEEKKCEIEERFGFNEIFKYGMIIGFSQMLGQISNLLDQNIVASMFSPAEYAVYVNGAVDIPFIALIGTSIANVLLPEFAQKQDDDKYILEKWKSGMVYTAAFLIPIMVFVFVIAPTYITVVYSENYIESVTIFRIYLLNIPTKIATFSTILLAKKANGKVLMNTIIALVFNTLLNITLINLIGIKGAALAAVLTLYILALLQVIQIGKILNVPIKNVMPLKRIAIICSISIGNGIILGIIKWMVPFDRILYDIILAAILIMMTWILIIKSKVVEYKQIKKMFIKN